MKQYDTPMFAVILLDQTDLLTASEQVEAEINDEVGGFNDKMFF